MYSSLLPWCRFPVMVHRYLSTDVSGDATYAEPTAETCYRVDEMRKITDKYGTEYTSYATVYFPPNVTVSEADMLSFDDGAPCEIRKLQGYYDGNCGQLSIRVAYL